MFGVINLSVFKMRCSKTAKWNYNRSIDIMKLVGKPTSPLTNMEEGNRMCCTK